MKERPILFRGDMIRALLAGTKTQTRRVIKPQPDVTEERLRELDAWIDGFTLSRQVDAALQHGFIDTECPYGQPGDRLWVREAFQIMHRGDDWDIPIYRADDIAGHINGGWRPSIHMPHAACRLVLEITDVRVERLQDISEADAIAEGCDNSQSAAAVATGWYEKPISAYRRLWESLYGSGSWDANPYVWRISFKKVEA
ncbi:hypothetical protein [Chromobacterium haemolyticum]|uniref:hypothetical protein n=1 Tax=Chromobacterium haemolyticum TaxID=394935 RepID=UPI000DEEB242|nr:hypothetical protein [Chromobacterium haemolyticum]